MATINVNVDEKIKEQAKPFEIKVPKINAETIKAIEDAERFRERGLTNYFVV